MQMLWTLSTLLLLAVWSGRVRGAVVTENGLPILWAEAPSQLSDLPQQDGTLTINPWNYLQRMSLYRLLLAATDQYMSSMGPNVTEGNPLWDLPLQLGWKLRSGRLMDPSGATNCGKESDPMCISGKSWWSCVNYFLSVVPFLAAVQRGMIGSEDHIQVRVQVPADAAHDYCTSYADCSAKFPQHVAKWEAFFQGLKDLNGSAIPDVDKRDQLLGLMWDAQQHSLHEVSSTCQGKQVDYSSKEKDFASSWLASANYVASVHFHSNIEYTEPFMTPLPSRVLKEGDRAPNIPDLSAEENHILYIFSWVTSMDRMLGGTLVRMWDRVMCSQKAREKGQALLRELVLNPKFSITSLFSILRGMSTSC